MDTFFDLLIFLGMAGAIIAIGILAGKIFFSAEEEIIAE